MAKTLILNKPVIAITGSAGKTTTKELLAAVLSQKWQIFKTPRNLNHSIHTRRYAKQIKRKHKALVLEYGMSEPGTIRRHCRWIQPNIGIITNVGQAHIGNFNGQISGIAAAKSELIQHMKPDGTLFLNADDANSSLLKTETFAGTIKTVGIDSFHSDFRAYHVEFENKGLHFTVNLNQQPYLFKVPLHGRHNVYNALFAIAVAHELGFAAPEIQAGLSAYKRPKRRLILYTMRDGIKIIDDSFSANPTAMKAAIDVLATVGRNKKIAVFGSMLELGRLTGKAHREIGMYVARKQVDELFAYGKHARKILQGALSAGFSSKRMGHFRKKRLLHRILLKRITPETTVLVKGSYRTKMHETVRYLKRMLRKRKKE